MRCALQLQRAAGLPPASALSRSGAAQGKPQQRRAAPIIIRRARCTPGPQPHQVRQPGSEGRLQRRPLAQALGPQPRGQHHTRLAPHPRPPRTGSRAPLLPQHWTCITPPPDAQAHQPPARTPGDNSPCGCAMDHTDRCACTPWHVPRARQPRAPHALTARQAAPASAPGANRPPGARRGPRGADPVAAPDPVTTPDPETAPGGAGATGPCGARRTAGCSGRMRRMAASAWS